MRSNDDKLELFAYLLEPVAMILADERVTGIVQRGEPAIRAVASAIRNHKKETIEIMARLEGVKPESYQFDGIRVTAKMMQYFNRPDVQQMVNELFTSPQQGGGASSGDATDNTQDGAK